MLQGGNVSVHNLPDCLVLPVQHAPFPGGRLPHPDPPHAPHSMGQQTLPVWIPDKHPGSDVIASSGLGLADGFASAEVAIGDALLEALGEADGEILVDGDAAGGDMLEDGVVDSALVAEGDAVDVGGVTGLSAGCFESNGEGDEEGFCLGRIQGAPTWRQLRLDR